ncbi:MAG: NYN domain-containing protein [Nanoarchaeota archaeon]|nr:NYN domain-containing protein [Nanoarchaeota archaeon]
MEETLIFIDEGFLSQLSKHFGDGKYIKIDYLKFAKNLAKKQDLFFKHLFYYTAPPFQSEPLTEDQIKRKQGYDKFIASFEKNKEVTIRQGRCQKIINDKGKFEYRQKGVDALMVSDMVSTPIKFPNIKKIILITSDTDFCPIIGDINQLGIKVILYTYYERKRKSKFSVSHHLIDCCEDTFYISKKDFEEAIK